MEESEISKEVVRMTKRVDQWVQGILKAVEEGKEIATELKELGARQADGEVPEEGKGEEEPG